MAPKPATEQPGNSFKYLYWRLSEGQFQQLCGSLLRQKYPSVQCLPIGMADGGIDQMVDGSIVFQDKWTSKCLQNPETWLDKTIDGERENIKRLVREKRISRYVLMTSVAGTTTAKGTGSIQKLQPKLDGYTKEFKIPVECWWQSDIDAEVDAAPDAIKWSYHEMLAGTEAMRYLMHGSQVEGQAARMRDTLILVMASQWREDSKIKFSQFDVPHANIADLYVDVQVSLQSAPRNAVDAFFSKSNHSMYESLGAVSYMLRTTAPLTYLLGVPGQGKSTLGQYLSQMHRAAILPGDTVIGGMPAEAEVADPKLPLRLDLKDYAAWLSGDDPFGEDETSLRSKPRPKSQRSLDLFIAKFCEFHSGGREVTVEDVQSLLERYPTFLVLDGLDEVADPELRAVIVDQINLTCTRMGLVSKARQFQVLVTARPNASGLSEPDKDMFQTLRLKPLDTKLQRQFLGKWCDVNEVYGSKRRELRRIFEHRTAHEHVAQLADNPMQLTILLFLINKNGESVPVARTPLYRDYLEALLSREVTRKQIAREQVPYVKEVTAFLGWHMHSGVETSPAAGRMTQADIETSLLIYFQRTEGPSQQVATLFKAATDRFWALSSKVEHTFEFAVQPLREYFAASFLADWAGRDRLEVLSKQEVLRHLVARPYWLNTARFYAGFASPNELASLRYGLEELMEEQRHPFQERTALWTLLSDGIFANSTTVQRDVVSLVTDDLSVILVANHPDAIANFPSLAHGSGAGQMTSKLLQMISENPHSGLNRSRTAILRDKTGVGADEFLSWWRPRFQSAASTQAEQTAWLNIAGSFKIPRLLDGDLATLTVDGASSCRAALYANASPRARSPLDRTLLAGVLSGWCSDVSTSSTSEAGALLRTMRPQWFQHNPAFNGEPSLGVADHLLPTEADRTARTAAWRTLVEIDDRYRNLQKACRPGMGQQGTTEPWQKPAIILKQLHGPNWLAAEIAITGAANRSVKHSGTFTRGGQPFGNDVDYGTLVLRIHQQPDEAWWASMYQRHADGLSRRMWVLALIAAAEPQIVFRQLDKVDEVLSGLPQDEFDSLADSSSRIGRGQACRRLGDGIWSRLGDVSDRTLLLVTHFTASLAANDPLSALSDERLARAALSTASSWPIARAMAARMLGGGSAALLRGLTRLVGTRPPSTDLDVESWEDAVLADPASFPVSWVLEAEQRRSSAVHESPLEQVALREEWLPKVPRL
ncbi:NACHT domain-containing NTPase [Mycobacterium sp. SA01]|uniref:NACHT domain-containing protein n=1 Tax=Mycobacterium sp. SA01 TaxID=3238820 RepID=UPI00351B40D0